MTDFINAVTGTPAFGALCAAAAAFACFGTGAFALKRFAGLREDLPVPAAFAVGIALSALTLALLGFCGLSVLWPIVFLAGFAAAVPNAKMLVPRGRWIFVPLALLVFFCGNLLTAPSDWDELVYQLTVPLRWNADGAAKVYSDLPYSGFPLLPQFLYQALIAASGVSAAKAFSFLTLGAVILSPFAFRRCGGIAGTAVSCALLCTPVVQMLLKGTYSEQYIALMLVSGILLIRRGAPGEWTGFCAGAAFAVKLTGGFLIPALFLPGILAARKKGRFTLGFALGGFLCALPFFLRPLILTGNPLYPYFGFLFGHDAAMLEMSAFHHAVGGAVFGSSSGTVWFTAPFLLGIPPYDELFDGSFGWQWFPLLAFAAAFAVLRFRDSGAKAVLPLLWIPAVLYFCWIAAAQQSRFLLPLAVYAAIGAGCFLSGCGIRLKTGLALLLGVVSIFMLFSTNYPAAALARWRWSGARVDHLYTETGDSYLPSADLLRRFRGKTLLLFEERTLYLPQTCVIATPFFQSAYFTPPDGFTPEKVLETMKNSGAERLYFRVPGNDPDLSRPHLDRCAALLNSLLKLEKDGILRRTECPGRALIYELREP